MLGFLRGIRALSLNAVGDRGCAHHEWCHEGEGQHDGREEHRQDDAEGDGREHRDPRHARSRSALRGRRQGERPGLHAADHSRAAVDQSHAGADRREGRWAARRRTDLHPARAQGEQGARVDGLVCACHALSLDPRPVGRTAVGDPNAVGGDGDGGMDPREVRVSEADVCRAASSDPDRAWCEGELVPRVWAGNHREPKRSAGRTVTRMDLSGLASWSHRQHGAVDEGAFADDLCARKCLARNVYGVIGHVNVRALAQASDELRAGRAARRLHGHLERRPPAVGPDHSHLQVHGATLEVLLGRPAGLSTGLWTIGTDGAKRSRMPWSRPGGVPGSRQGRVRVEAVGHVESEVRELIRRTGLDPSRDTYEIDRLVRDAVADYDERSLHGGLPTLPDLEGAVKSVLDAVAGFGPLQKYFDDPDGRGDLDQRAVARCSSPVAGVAELTTTILTADEVRDLVERMLKTSGRRVDLSSPVRRRDAARRVAAARRHPRHHPRALARQHPQVRRPGATTSTTSWRSAR